MTTIRKVTAEITVQNTFSDEILIPNAFNFGLIGTAFVGTVTLQRRMDATDVWRDVTTKTADFEGWDIQPGGAELRFGVKTGDYTSGSIIGFISRAKN
tara:strand:- start:1137 stop:1430 length:294 start_codon:yes stop_codon:yes gene_type:complete